ncbi:MAG TPA: GNAT family N-acetyltransferase [Anaerolineae bacterium]|nr:GNAT family N-acetyltransferase [Anaerolineae bacterium]HIQ05619.1 GNAT family N-acetyltransferase [Anaerolineae bacterium]
MSDRVWDVVRYDLQNEVHLEKVRAFVSRRDLYHFPDGNAHFEWMYLNNPAGLAHLFVGEDRTNGNMAGMTGYFPWPMVWHGQQLAATQNADIAVDPAYRRQGMFVTMARRAIHEGGLAEAGVALVFGFPNEAAVRGHRRLQAIEVGPVETWWRPLDVRSLLIQLMPKPLATIVGTLANPFLSLLPGTRQRSPEGYHCHPITHFDDRFDGLWQRVQSSLADRLTVVRNARYLNWKYFEDPAAEFVVLVCEQGDVLHGYLVTHVGTRVTAIDALADSAEALSALIEALVTLGKERKAALVSFRALAGHPYFPIFQRHGFRWRHAAGPHFIAYPIDPTLDQTALADPNAWFITTGDHDWAYGSVSE